MSNYGAVVGPPQVFPDQFQGKEYKTVVSNKQTTERVWALSSSGIAQPCQENVTLSGCTAVTRGRVMVYGSGGVPVYDNLTDQYEFD